MICHIPEKNRCAIRSLVAIIDELGVAELTRDGATTKMVSTWPRIKLIDLQKSLPAQAKPVAAPSSVGIQVFFPVSLSKRNKV